MLLYNSIGPNPKVVRMFMAERGIDIPRVEKIRLLHRTPGEDGDTAARLEHAP